MKKRKLLLALGVLIIAGAIAYIANNRPSADPAGRVPVKALISLNKISNDKKSAGVKVNVDYTTSTGEVVKPLGAFEVNKSNFDDKTNSNILNLELLPTDYIKMTVVSRVMSGNFRFSESQFQNWFSTPTFNDSKTQILFKVTVPSGANPSINLGTFGIEAEPNGDDSLDAATVTIDVCNTSPINPCGFTSIIVQVTSTSPINGKTFSYKYMIVNSDFGGWLKPYEIGAPDELPFGDYSLSMLKDDTYNEREKIGKPEVECFNKNETGNCKWYSKEGSNIFTVDQAHIYTSGLGEHYINLDNPLFVKEKSSAPQLTCSVSPASVDLRQTVIFTAKVSSLTSEPIHYLWQGSLGVVDSDNDGQEQYGERFDTAYTTPGNKEVTVVAEGYPRASCPTVNVKANSVSTYMGSVISSTSGTPIGGQEIVITDSSGKVVSSAISVGSPLETDGKCGGKNCNARAQGVPFGFYTVSVGAVKHNIDISSDTVYDDIPFRISPQ